MIEGPYSRNRLKISRETRVAFPMVFRTSWRAEPSGEKPTCMLGSAWEMEGAHNAAISAMSGMPFIS